MSGRKQVNFGLERLGFQNTYLYEWSATVSASASHFLNSSVGLLLKLVQKDNSWHPILHGLCTAKTQRLNIKNM